MRLSYRRVRSRTRWCWPFHPRALLRLHCDRSGVEAGGAPLAGRHLARSRVELHRSHRIEAPFIAKRYSWGPACGEDGLRALRFPAHWEQRQSENKLLHCLMGLQDRDYYREWWSKRFQSDEPRRPGLFRKRATRFSPPPLWGADWHWSLKLLVWLAIAVLLLAAIRLLR